MKNRIFFIVFVFVSILKVGATEQVSDLLIIKNDTFYLKTFPLEKLNLKKSPFMYGNYSFPHTGCWRGYIATWKIIDDKLFLLQVEKADTSNEKLDIIKYFKQNNYTPKLIDGLILADWYSDTLARYDYCQLYFNSDRFYLINYYPQIYSNIDIELIFEKGQLIENRIKRLDSYKKGDILWREIKYNRPWSINLGTTMVEAIILENSGETITIEIKDYGTRKKRVINKLKTMMQIFNGKGYSVNPRYWNKKE